MNILILILKKDLSVMKGWVLVGWLTQLLSIAFIYRMNSQIGVLETLTAVLYPMVLFIVVVQIIQGDAFAGTTSFLMSRPISRFRVLIAKILFLVLFLVLPHVLLLLLKVELMGIRLSVMDGALLLLETALNDFLFIAWAILAGSFTRLWSLKALIAVVLILGFAVTSNFLSQIPGSFSQAATGRHLADSRVLIWIGWMIFCALSAAYLWTRHRSLGISAAAFLVLVFAGYSGILRWRWNFVDELSGRLNPSELLMGTPKIEWLEETTSGSNSTRNGVRYFSVKKRGRIQGLKAGWDADLSSRRAIAEFSDGSWRQSLIQVDQFNGLTPLSGRYVKRLGIPLPERQVSRLSPMEFGWNLFECAADKLPHPNAAPIKVRGSGEFDLYQPVALAQLPLKKDARIIAGRIIYEIARVRIYDSQIQVTLSVTRLVIRSRGERTNTGTMECLLLNPETQEVAEPGGGSGSGSFGRDTSVYRRSFSLSRENGKPATPEEFERFLKGARLYVLERKEAGTINLPYELNDISPSNEE